MSVLGVSDLHIQDVHMLIIYLLIPSGSSVIPQRQLNWRLKWQKLRTQSLRPSSLYHNWMENIHGGTHRLFDKRVCLFVFWCEKGARWPHKSNRRCVRERETDRKMYPAWVLSPFWLFFLLSTASVCTLIKTLNLFLTHTLTHSLTLPTSLKACTEDLIYSVHTFSYTYTWTHTLHP